MKPNVLFVDGVPDDGKVLLTKVNKDGSFKIVTSGSCNIAASLLNNPYFNVHYLLLDRNPTQEIELKNIHAVFNQISDPDTHTVTLDKAENLLNQLKEGTPIFNSPLYIKNTSRDQIFNLLKGTPHITIPTTIKIYPKNPIDIYRAMKNYGISFPIILKEAGFHGGVHTFFIVDDAIEHLYPVALNGRPYYLIQYIDYQVDHIYTKYRLVVIDGEVFLRHVLFDKEWNIHASSSRQFMNNHPQFNDREKEIFSNFESEIKPKIQKTIKHIHAELQLDYFGIDCLIRDNYDLLIFEINPNMNVFALNSSNQTSYHNKALQSMHNALINLIQRRIFGVSHHKSHQR